MVEVRDELENNESTLDSSINVKMNASSEKYSFKEGDIVWAKAKRSKAFWPAKIQETHVEVDDLNESKSQAEKRGIKQAPLVKVVLYGSGKIELVSRDNLKIFKSPEEFNEQYKKTAKSKEFNEAIGEAEKDLKMSTSNEQPSEELEATQQLKPTEEELASESINARQQNDDTAMAKEEETSVSPKLSGAKKETTPQKPTRLSIQPSPCLRPLVRASIATGLDVIKTPPKQITEREKQRREMNKLKGQNLVECLNKHIEVYQKVKSSQLELSSKKENEKGKSLKRSRSFDTRKETEKNVTDENQSNISRSQIEIPQKSNDDEDEEKNEENNEEAKTKRTKTVDDLKRLLEDENMLSLSMPKSSKFTTDLLDESRNRSPKSIEKKENSSQKSQNSKTKNKNTTSTFKYSNVSILVNSGGGEEKSMRDEVKNLIEQLRELIATVDLEDEDDEKRICVYDLSLTSSENAENVYGLNEAAIFDSDRKKGKKRKKADDSDNDKTSKVRVDFEQNIDSISRPTSSTKLVISLLSNNNRRPTDDDSDDEEIEQDSSKTTLIEEILVRQKIKNIDVVSLRPLSKSNSAFFHYWLKENGANFLELAVSQKFGVVYAMSANKSFFCSLKSLIEKLIKNNSKIEFIEPGQSHSIMANIQELDSRFKQMVDLLKLVKNITGDDELKVIGEALNN